MKLGHVAVFTNDMEKSIKFYTLLGGKVSMEDLLELGEGKSKKLVHIAFDGEGTIELVEPSSDDMMLFGAGVCEHFCFNVENVDDEFARLKALGVDTFDKDAPYTLDLFGGVKVIFLTGPSSEIIELFQQL